MPSHAKLLEQTPAPAARATRAVDTAPQTRIDAPRLMAPGGAGLPLPSGGRGNMQVLQRLVGNQAVLRMLDVQRAAGDLREPSDETIRAAATEGVRTPSTPLPYLDRIQASFGRHSIGDIQAHVGPAATRASRAMNAQAFATGNHVVFGAKPDLRTAAHEAAHIVQQRAGVQLAGGIGRVDDPYERHADAVADAVARGERAEALLEGLAAGGGTPRVQRQWERFALDNADVLQATAVLRDVRYVAWNDELHTLFAIANNHVWEGQRGLFGWVWTALDADLTEAAMGLAEKNGFPWDLVGDLVSNVRDPGVLKWIVSFGIGKLSNRDRYTIAQLILRRAVEADVPLSELKSEFDTFEPLKGVRLRSRYNADFDAWKALARYYLKGKDEFLLYHRFMENLDNRQITADARAAIKAMADELKPAPQRGRGGAGTLVVGQDEHDRVSIAGRPAFEEDAQNLPGVRSGFHRRHILAWHTIRAGTQNVVNRLLDAGIDPDRITAVFEGLLTRLDRQLGSDGFETMSSALSALNSNVRNLWPGEGYQNSLINVYQRMLRDWALELAGKDERAVLEWYESTGSITRRIQNKQANADPNAAQYARALGDLAQYVDEAVISYRKDVERAQTSDLHEIRAEFTKLADDNPTALVADNLRTIYDRLSQPDIDIGTINVANFANAVRGMSWTESNRMNGGMEVEVEHADVRQGVINAVRRRHFFKLDYAGRRLAGDELASMLLMAADNLEVDFAFEGGATARRFARGNSRTYLDQAGVNWSNEDEIWTARERDPVFAHHYAQAQQETGRFINAVQKMLVWADAVPAQGTANDLIAEFETFLTDFMGL